MKTLLIRAYDVKGYQITGPSWIDTEQYEIAATIPAGATKEQAAQMLQNLLAERFHLSAHRETKDLPIFALLTGKNSPKLKESDPAAAAEDEKAMAAGNFTRPKVTVGPDGFPQVPPDTKFPGTFTLSTVSGEFTRIKIIARHETMEKLANTIAGFLNRPVKNLTQLPGQYDFTLAFETDPHPDLREGRPPAPSSDPGPTIFTAVQEQLGLKLEQRKGQVEMLIVDRVERVPTGN